jgi:hypothetical protein
MKFANKISFNKATLFLSLMIFWGISYQASATCSYVSGQGPLVMGFTPSAVIVQRDAPVGSVIYSSTSEIGPELLTCQGDNTNYYKMTYLGGVATSIAHAYATNIDGVAIEVDLAWGKLDNPPSTDYTGTSTVNIPWIRYRLYKTGDIKPGQFMVGQVGTWTVSDITPVTINLMGGYVSQVACSITTPNLTFPIGDVLNSEFGTTVGYIPAKTSTQNLGLDCDRNANINVTLNGTQNPDVSDASVLALNNQGEVSPWLSLFIGFILLAIAYIILYISQSFLVAFVILLVLMISTRLYIRKKFAHRAIFTHQH